MKKILLLSIITIGCLHNASAQKKKTVAPQKSVNAANVSSPKPAVKQYPNFSDFKHIVQLESIRSSTHAIIGDKDDVSLEVAKAMLQDTIDNAKPGNDQIEFLKKIQPLVNKYFDGIYKFGEAPAKIYLGKNDMPFNLALKDGDLIFAQTGVYSQYSINTIRLEKTERYKKMAGDILIPSLKNLEPLTKEPLFKYFMITAGYLAKDFTKEYSMGSGELICILVSRPVLLQYINAEISNKDLLKSASFYTSSVYDSGISKVDLDF